MLKTPADAAIVAMVMSAFLAGCAGPAKPAADAPPAARTVLMSVVLDDDTPNRPLDGLIGVQVHVGPPMKVEYRNIRLKNW